MSVGSPLTNVCCGVSHVSQAKGQTTQFNTSLYLKSPVSPELSHWGPAGEIYKLEFKCIASRGGLALDVSSAKPKVIVQSFTEDLKLFFAGKVSLRRSALSFPLCKIVTETEGYCSDRLEVPVYICGDEFKDVGAECPVPAWQVGVCISGKDGKVSKDESPTMKLVLESISFSLPPVWSPEEGDPKSVVISMPILQPLDGQHLKEEWAELRYIVDKKRKRISPKSTQEVYDSIGAGGLCKKVIEALELNVGLGGRKTAKPNKTSEVAHLLR
jgi:hypothetical protein